jgi:hypothetical protein
MRSYPKYIATKQDFNNLLAIPEYKDQVLADLKLLQAIDDVTVLRIVSGSTEEGNLVTEEIDNPNPVWMQKGFVNKAELDSLISSNEV